jgi:hypothetical protein
MTVCIGSAFTWVYGPGDVGRAIVAVSDRKLTIGGMEYEPRQTKMWPITPQIMALLAGDMLSHSDAITHFNANFTAHDGVEVGEVAHAYAQSIQSGRRKRAETEYLSPIGIDIDRFRSGQVQLSDGVTLSLIRQMQEYNGCEVEAIVAGTNGRTVNLYGISDDLQVACYDDAGFVAVGSGGWLARAGLMTAKYTPSVYAYTTALLTGYAAKKQAEMATGVGSDTDMYLITRTGHQPVLDEIKESVRESLEKYQEKNRKIAAEAIEDIEKFFNAKRKQLEQGQLPPVPDQVANDASSSKDQT